MTETVVPPESDASDGPAAERVGVRVRIVLLIDRILGRPLTGTGPRATTPAAEVPEGPAADPASEPSGEQPATGANETPAGGPAEDPVTPAAPPDGQWVDLAKSCVDLFDELDRSVGEEGEGSAEAEHVMLRLAEILERSGVEIIDGEVAFDRRRHRNIDPTVRAATEAPLTETVRPGFAIGSRILRQARVRVAQADER
ncbi:nucleotide exchange factor GrpE [Actinomycetospora aeridis]|uniref:Nucleotide exchange factor GrpE n=1 Tax=Actinomycetospora aeridis TaxID=3129231 RepID=A0ABU8N7L7_9PSEU